MRLYTVYDKLALTWSPPFIQENDSVAYRTFSVLLRQHPDTASDMELHCLGDWVPSGSLHPLSLHSETGPVDQVRLMEEAENAAH